MQESKQLKHRLYLAFIAVAITFVVAIGVTFAWYIYNTQKHTTNVHMAAGAGASLTISNTYDGDYNKSVELGIVGTLNPVSTSLIRSEEESKGFQKVYGFTNGDESRPKLLASIFGPSENSDYYNTTLFLKTNGGDTKVYLSNIGYKDNDDNNPISTAIRVGIIPHQPGKNQPESTQQYFFEINTASNPQANNNTESIPEGKAGYALDSSKTDGSTVSVADKTFNSDNYCIYDSETGMVTLKPKSQPLLTLSGNGSGGDGVPVQVDVYIWLEGCDQDCTNNLCAMTLENLALSFAGYKE